MDTSLARGKRIKVDLVEDADRISKLPDDVLLLILDKLSTEEVVQTGVLSKRWKDVWKNVPILFFDMSKTDKLIDVESLADRSDFVAKLITKVINNHNGNLRGCIIHHFSYQCRDSFTLQNWIHTLTHEKNTKNLALANRFGDRTRDRVLPLLPSTFSHRTLKSLFLYRYDLETAHAFNNCHNLKILKLDKICAEVGVLNTIIASCTSLRILALQITWSSEIGCLKIHHNNLKLLRLACSYIDQIEVYADFLDIFIMDYLFATKDNVVLKTPRLLKFSKNYSVADEKSPHLSYNISYHPQENENIWHAFLLGRSPSNFRPYTSLAVSVNLMDPREVDMFKRLLFAWGGERRELEIFFKHDNVRKEEGESSNDGAQKKKWEEKRLILNADLSVEVLWMYNFSGSNEKEFALVSRFVTQGTVEKKMMIKMSSFSAAKKLAIETAVTKLMKLPKGNKELSIECF